MPEDAERSAVAEGSLPAAPPDPHADAIARRYAAAASAAAAAAATAASAAGRATGSAAAAGRASGSATAASAAGRATGCDAGACDPEATSFGLRQYTADQLAEVGTPGGVLSLGCGNPLAGADIRAGETVLDLGSGAGLDLLLSARRVGPTGRAIGLDMTPEMVELARRHAAAAGADNVEVHLGRIEQIPLPDESVDVVVSNCVLNLSAEKGAVLREAARVLRPGGRLGVSDLLAADDADPAELAASAAAIGAGVRPLTAARYRELLGAAGLERIGIERTQTVGAGVLTAIVQAIKPAVRPAVGPAVGAGAGPGVGSAVGPAVGAGAGPGGGSGVGPVTVRAMRDGDWPAVSSIYADGIATGDATFETEVPSWERWDAAHLPNHRLVAELDGAVVGWTAVSPVSRRSAYAGVVEHSVYVAAAARGRGVGRLLLAALVESTERAGVWTIQTGIFPENEASLTLHRSAGFRVLGVRERPGEMGGRWRDVVLLERRSSVAGV